MEWKYCKAQKHKRACWKLSFGNGHEAIMHRLKGKDDSYTLLIAFPKSKDDASKLEHKYFFECIFGITGKLDKVKIRMAKIVSELQDTFKIKTKK